MPVEFKLPELGENIEKGDVARVLVKVGDTVVRDQAIMELETDKATIEVPSSVAGKVLEVRVKAGEKASVGQVVIVVDDAAGGAPAAAPAAAAAQPGTPARDEPEVVANTRQATADVEATPGRPTAPPVVDITAAVAVAPAVAPSARVEGATGAGGALDAALCA